ncbi:hypothetical protein NQ318_017463 [Aromia moschata]|uniref:Fanconi anemia group D2 protein n=1 Tax=Aromia moschata TaxID=1265417 RepID=A0AAV8Z3S6_9CUCU|nr:hypothetical protein NQ318_017463 [Aromia moschata]
MVEKESGSIQLLAPHFRLLRIVHYRQQARDLSSIDALLGCAIILPDVEDAMDLDTDQVRQVADCLFHCTNWFREVINAFVTQKSKSLRTKVVRRLQQVIEVEKKLASFMEKIPDHKLPAIEIGDETVASTSAATQSKKKKPASKAAAAPELNINFREMDTDLILLVKYPLKFDSDDDELFGTQTATLQIDQLQFILKDYVMKLSLLTQGKNIGLSHLSVVSVVSMMSDLPQIMPLLDSHFKVVAKRLSKLLEEVGRKYDSPELYTEEAQDLITTFGLLLEVYYHVFSWTGFQHSRNLDLLKNLLRSLVQGQSQSLSSANRLIAEFINRLAGYDEQCLQMAHAVSIVKTMEALYSATSYSKEIEKKILTVAGKLLGRRWYNSRGLLDCGKNHNANTDVLVKVYLKGADVKTLCGLVGTLQEQVAALKNKDDCLQMFPGIHTQNFHVFYAGVCGALLSRIKTEVQSLTNSQHLQLWRNTAKMMQALMDIAKERDTKIYMVCFLKKSIGILNVFLTHGMPILEITLRSKPDDVVAILKDVQVITRFLHHLCCHSKNMKNGSLVAHVPKFRLLLETLVYKVKATLVANNCSAAFWMGNLRNRDLQGEDILSQSTSVTGDNGNSDEELPADDSDDDILGGEENRSNNGDEGSVESEVFD